MLEFVVINFPFNTDFQFLQEMWLLCTHSTFQWPLYIITVSSSFYLGHHNPRLTNYSQISCSAIPEKSAMWDTAFPLLKQPDICCLLISQTHQHGLNVILRIYCFFGTVPMILHMLTTYKIMTFRSCTEVEEQHGYL
jgi:hypothetical protein